MASGTADYTNSAPAVCLWDTIYGMLAWSNHLLFCELEAALLQ